MLYKEIHRSYAGLLKTHEWWVFTCQVHDAKNGKCEICEDERELQVHHLGYETGRMPWEYEFNEVQLLCKTCHHDLHLFADELWNECLKLKNKWAIYECGKGVRAFIESNINPPKEKATP